MSIVHGDIRNNVSVGQKALHDTKSETLTGRGYDNTAMGANALAEYDGNESTGVGSHTLSHATGGENTAYGAHAGTFLVGTHNTATGGWAMRFHTGSKGNTASGFRSMAGTLLESDPGHGKYVSCDENTAYGAHTLRQNKGHKNTAHGYMAGHGNIDGSKNTFLGHMADTVKPGIKNATAIGAETVVTKDNTMILGNGTANVGIGTTEPTADLHIVSKVDQGTALAIEGGNVHITTGEVGIDEGDVFVTNGNVGIGAGANPIDARLTIVSDPSDSAMPAALHAYGGYRIKCDLDEYGGLIENSPGFTAAADPYTRTHDVTFNDHIVIMQDFLTNSTFDTGLPSVGHQFNLPKIDSTREGQVFVLKSRIEMGANTGSLDSSPKYEIKIGLNEDDVLILDDSSPYGDATVHTIYSQNDITKFGPYANGQYVFYRVIKLIICGGKYHQISDGNSIYKPEPT